MILELSPTVKAILLVLIFGILLVAGNTVDSISLSVTLYILAGASYITFIIYTTQTFDYTADQTFLLLAVSSALFIALGYGFREKGWSIDRNHSRQLIAVLLLLVSVFLALDILSPTPAYETQFKSSVTLQDTGNGLIGNITVKNRFLFSREIDLPDYQACLYTPEKTGIYLHYDHQRMTDHIPGRSTETFHLYASQQLRDRNQTTLTVPIEWAQQCPDQSSTEKLVLTDNSGMKPSPLPAP